VLVVDVVVDVAVVVEVVDDVVVVGDTLHLPALPAAKIAWTSLPLRARLKSSTSSINPCQASAGITTFLPMTIGSVTASIAPVCAMLARSTPLT